MCEISIVASCTTFMLQLFHEQSDLKMAVSDLDSSFCDHGAKLKSELSKIELVGGMMLQPIQPLTQMSASELIAVSVCSTTTSISLPSPSAFYSTSRSLCKHFECPPGIPNLLLLEGSLPPGGSFHPAPVSTKLLSTEPHRLTWTRSIIGASKIYLKNRLFWGACSMNRPPLTT